MSLQWMKVVLIILLAAVSVALMIRYLDITSIACSFALNFVLMFWFTLFESQLKPGLNSRYFQSAPFEKQGHLYRMLGVEAYRAVLTKIGWEKMRQQQTPIKKNLSSLQAYERASRVAETGHLVIGFLVLVLTGYVALTHSLAEARWLILFNVLFNIYPILLQRYTRPRLQGTIRRFQSARTVSAVSHS